MILETLNEIGTLLDTNEEAASRLIGLKDKGEAVRILSEYGINVSVTDLDEAVTLLTSDEIPEELLDLVAGGKGKIKKVAGKVRDFLWGFCDGLSDGWNDTKGFFESVASSLGKGK